MEAIRSEAEDRRMQFFQGYLYALRLKPQKEALLRRWVGCRRWVWNEALAMTASMQPIKFTLDDGVLQASSNKRRKGDWPGIARLFGERT